MVHHRRGLRRLLKDETVLRQIDREWRTADLSLARRTMLEFGIKLTLTPGAMVEPDVEKLRVAGFSDRDVLDIVEVVSYYAYVNRIADGLGVSVEDWYPPDPSEDSSTS